MYTLATGKRVHAVMHTDLAGTLFGLESAAYSLAASAPDEVVHLSSSIDPRMPNAECPLGGSEVLQAAAAALGRNHIMHLVVFDRNQTP